MGELVRLRALEESDAESEYYAITPDFDSESERMGDAISLSREPRAHGRRHCRNGAA